MVAMATATTPGWATGGRGVGAGGGGVVALLIGPQGQRPGASSCSHVLFTVSPCATSYPPRLRVSPEFTEPSGRGSTEKKICSGIRKQNIEPHPGMRGDWHQCNNLPPNRVTVKTSPCFRQSYTCFGYEGEIGVERIFLKINLSTTISMERSRREFSIDVVIFRGICKNNQSTLFP